MVGIIVGAVAGLALIAFLITHSLRRRARNRRTANRSSLFEPWPAPAPVSLEDEHDGAYEKARYDGAGGPAGSYAMHEQSYDPYGNNTGGGGYDAYGSPIGHAGGYDPAQQAYYQQQGYAQYPDHGQNYGYGNGAGVGAAAAVGAAGAAAGLASGGSQEQHGNGTGSAVAAQMGLRDGMMVNVKVGFVRTLEDELGTSLPFSGSILFHSGGFSTCIGP